MNGHLETKIKVMILGLGIFMSSSIFNFAYAQYNPFSITDPETKVVKRDAEIIFENFHKFGVSIQAHYLPIFNNSNYEFTNYYPDRVAWAVGIDYNFYQTRNFNFRLGGYVRNFNVAEKIDIPYNTVNIDRPDNLTFTFSEGPNWNYNLNFSIEYIAFILKNHAINYYLGSEVMYFDQGASGTQTLNSLSINNIPVRETSFYFIEEKVTIGLTTGVGLYSRIGKTMIRTNFNYKFSLTGEIFSEFHRWKNLNNPTSSNIGFHGWNGHHFSFSITIHPGRKNIKERLRNLGQ